MKKDLLVSIGKLLFEIIKLCGLMFFLSLSIYSVLKYFSGGQL